MAANHDRQMGNRHGRVAGNGERKKTETETERKSIAVSWMPQSGKEGPRIQLANNKNG